MITNIDIDKQESAGDAIEEKAEEAKEKARTSSWNRQILFIKALKLLSVYSFDFVS